MADRNWLTLSGNEIVNTARAQAYAAGVESSDTSCGSGGSVGCSCPGLGQAIEGDGFEGYTDPVIDQAPWIEPTVPTSAEFLGVVGLEAEGLSNGTMTRTPTPLASHGSNIGVARANHREVTWTVVLVARSQAGLSYGLSWLSSALRDSGCGSAECWGGEACVFSWCPSSEGEGDVAQRLLYDTGLLEGPTVTQEFHAHGDMWFATVEFTLVHGVPWVFSLPYIHLDTGDSVEEIVVVPAGGPQVECEDALPCRADPDCPPPPLPPRPPQPTDPCWPLTRFRAVRHVFTIPPPQVAAWFTTVPVVRVESGGAPMRRLSVRFYANPTGSDCSRWTDRCAACGEVNIAYLPPETELVLDGRRKRSQMDCSGGRGLALSTPIPYGPNGGLFTWPEIECASGLCVEVLWQQAGSSPDAQVTVEMVQRMESI